MIAPPIYEALSAWLALKRPATQRNPFPQANVSRGTFTGILTGTDIERRKLAEEEFERTAPPIDKRRRGVAELRHRAEQASMKPAEHQAQVTAKNIKAMEG